VKSVQVINLIDRILIVGLGSIGKRHLKLARELVPTADIRVLRHQHTNEVPEYSNGCFFNIEDAINFCPQVAAIASPASLHVEVAQRLAELGTHLLVEKPLSSSVDGVASLLQVCADYVLFGEN
jgi:predicted dehydrogenase